MSKCHNAREMDAERKRRNMVSDYALNMKQKEKNALLSISLNRNVFTAERNTPITLALKVNLSVEHVGTKE